MALRLQQHLHKEGHHRLLLAVLHLLLLRHPELFLLAAVKGLEQGVRPLGVAAQVVVADGRVRVLWQQQAQEIRLAPHQQVVMAHQQWHIKGLLAAQGILEALLMVGLAVVGVLAVLAQRVQVQRREKPEMAGRLKHQQ